MDNHAPVLVTLADGRVSVLGNIEGMNHDPFGHYSFFDWIKDYNRSTIDQLSANIVDIPLARYNPTVEALKPVTQWAEREAASIDNLSGLSTHIAVGMPDFQALMPQAEVFDSFKRLTELVSSNFELPPEVYGNLSQALKTDMPTTWIDAVTVAQETEGVEQAVHEFVEQNPEQTEELRTTFWSIAEKTPFDTPEKQLLWTLQWLGNLVFYAAETLGVVPAPVAIFLHSILSALEAPGRENDE